MLNTGTNTSKIDSTLTEQELKSLGSVRFDEKAVDLTFLIAMIGWITRSFWSDYLPMIDDYTICE